MQSERCDYQLRVESGCTATSPVRHQLTKFWLDRSFYFRPSESPVGGLNGMMKENLQPAPGSLSTQIFPPMPWTSRRAIASPSPMPSDFSVVGISKKKTKISK